MQEKEQVLTLIIGNKNYSSWSLRPWILLKKYSISFEEKRIALFTKTTDKELADYQSNNKVPVLVHGDSIIWDSLSIIEYISEQFLQGRGWPADSNARAYARSMSAEMHSSFSALRQEMPMNCRKQFKGIKLSSDAEADVERVANLWINCHRKFGVAGPWIAGDFSAVDAMYIPVALRLAGYGIKCSGFAAEYVQTVVNDESVQEWMQAGIKEKEIIEEDEIELI